METASVTYNDEKGKRLVCQIAFEAGLPMGEKISILRVMAEEMELGTANTTIEKGV